MNRSKSLETILVLVLALGILYWYFGKHTGFLLAAGIIAIIGLFLPVLAEKVHWTWMKFGEGMGYVVSKIVLTVVFLFILIPLSFVAKIFRKQASIKMLRGGHTYFKERNFTYTKESLENSW